MIAIQKGKKTAKILPIFQKKYEQAGWRVIKLPLDQPTDELAEQMLDGFSSRASNIRGRAKADPVKEANAITATELGKPPPKHFTDNLLKE